LEANKEEIKVLEFYIILTKIWAVTWWQLSKNV
jgi:hypothetical protein